MESLVSHLGSGFPRPIHGHLDGLRVGGYLDGVRRDDNRQGEALA